MIWTSGRRLQAEVENGRTLLSEPQITIPFFQTEAAEFNILFRCEWEEEHGFAAKFRDGLLIQSDSGGSDYC